MSGQYQLVPTKNGQSRIITAAPAVMAMLKRQRTRQAQMQLLAGEAWDNKWNLVFTDELGGHLPHVTVYKEFKAIVTAIGRPDARFHDLRHTYAAASIFTSGAGLPEAEERY